MNIRLLLLLVLLGITFPASTPALWSGNTRYKSSTYSCNVAMHSIISSSTTKTALYTLMFGVTYVAPPKLFYSIFKIASAPSTVFSFDVALMSVSTTGISANYSVGGSTTISSLSIYVLSFFNSSTTSFLSVNYALTAFTNCKIWSHSRFCSKLDCQLG